MQTSRVVEVDGIFIGAVILLGGELGWRFVATDHRASAADGRIAPTLGEAQMLAKRAFLAGRIQEPAGLPAGLPPPPARCQFHQAA